MKNPGIIAFCQDICKPGRALGTCGNKKNPVGTEEKGGSNPISSQCGLRGIAWARVEPPPSP